MRVVFQGVLRSHVAALGGAIVVLLVLTSVFAPILAVHDPLATELSKRDQPPSRQHLLGTDNFGRDLFSRIVWGGRLSLLLGVASVGLGSIFGVAIGLLSGYVAGSLDALLMRVIDVLIAFRLLLLAIVVMAILGPSLANTAIAIGLSMLAAFARLTRAEVLGAKEAEYVEAARAIGTSGRRIILKSIFPNILSPLIVLATLRLGEAILAEAALSFLGLGAGPPAPSWGLMVSEGLQTLRTAPWVSLVPGLAIMVTVLGFNLLGDGLRDALDPRLRGQGG